MAPSDRTPLDPGLIDLALVRARGTAKDAVLGALRKDKGMTAQGLADKTGYSFSTASQAAAKLARDGKIQSGVIRSGRHNVAVFWRAT